MSGSNDNANNELEEKIKELKETIARGEDVYADRLDVKEAGYARAELDKLLAEQK